MPTSDDFQKHSTPGRDCKTGKNTGFRTRLVFTGGTGHDRIQGHRDLPHRSENFREHLPLQPPFPSISTTYRICMRDSCMSWCMIAMGLISATLGIRHSRVRTELLKRDIAVDQTPSGKNLMSRSEKSEINQEKKQSKKRSHSLFLHPVVDETS